MAMDAQRILDSGDGSLFDVPSKARGPQGSVPVTPEMLLHRPSGDLFGWTQNAGMGWDPALLGGKEFLILSTHGGIRAADGTPVALGYHTGHWEVALLMDAAAKELKALGAVPFAAYCTDPCDGRTQGTTGMFDSLPYRNDAASIFGRLIRSLPTRRGVLGVATCDKGLPAMMMALAGARDLAGVLIPGGVTLLPEDGEDAAKVQSVGARFAHGQITLEDAAEAMCRSCASPGGGCQFLGTAATAQVVGEARAHRLHLGRVLALFGQQRHAARNQHARQIAGAGQRHHHGRQPLVARGHAEHAAARGQGADQPPENARRVVAVGPVS